LNHFIFAMGIGRVLIGLAPFVAAAPVARALGVPAGQDTPTTRLMGRWFGVRDIGLGVLIFWGLRHPEAMPFLTFFNSCTDFGDLFAIAIPLVRRQGIDRTAFSSALFAFPAGVTWLVLHFLLG
jgi:hypothetical protein